MKKEQKDILKIIQNTPLWLVITVVALIGIAFSKLTGSNSFSELLLLLLLVFIVAKLLKATKGFASLILKILLVFFVLSYWILIMAGF